MLRTRCTNHWQLHDLYFITIIHNSVHLHNFMHILAKMPPLLRNAMPDPTTHVPEIVPTALMRNSGSPLPQKAECTPETLR